MGRPTATPAALSPPTAPQPYWARVCTAPCASHGSTSSAPPSSATISAASGSPAVSLATTTPTRLNSRDADPTLPRAPPDLSKMWRTTPTVPVQWLRSTCALGCTCAPRNRCSLEAERPALRHQACNTQPWLHEGTLQPFPRISPDAQRTISRVAETLNDECNAAWPEAFIRLHVHHATATGRAGAPVAAFSRSRHALSDERAAAGHCGTATAAAQDATPNCQQDRAARTSR